MAQPDIRSVTRDELAGVLEGWGEKRYRTDQVLNWLYRRRAGSWDLMSNLPRPLRERLSEHYALKTFDLVTVQGAADLTRKFLWRLADGALIESVLIRANPALYGDSSDRMTLCVSSQVGCAYGCRFCASGIEGWRRNLGPEEFVEQVLAVERWHVESTALASPDQPPPTVPASSRLISNLVVMGMGEPLANYDNLLRALRVLNAPWGGGIGARKITISTSGLAPEIRRLANEPEQFRLAVSLHGPTDEVRSRLMPVNRRYPLQELMAACLEYQQRRGRMISFEYILIAGVNDQPNLVRPLADLARRVHAKVNLIPCNPVEGLPWQRPAEAVCEAFCEGLNALGVTATLRSEKGREIDAACGQLRLKQARAEGTGGATP